jgi:[ribosomal protein S5]-alanine N-acetyltransferase
METARLFLRDLRDCDAAALATALSNLNISRNTSSIPYPNTLADAVGFISRQKSKPSASLKNVITLKSNPQELIGSIRLHIDPVAHRCELGYWIAEPHWGRGYATEAAACMVDYAFTVLNFPAVLAAYNTDNPASGRVLYRLGFSQTGSGEDFCLAQGKSIPVTLVSLAKQQWQARKTNL